MFFGMLSFMVTGADEPAGRALINIGTVWSKLSQPQKAVPFLIRSLEMFQAMGNETLAAVSLNALFIAHSTMGAVGYDTNLSCDPARLPLCRRLFLLLMTKYLTLQGGAACL
jgi:hypothetical protein